MSVGGQAASDTAFLVGGEKSNAAENVGGEAIEASDAPLNEGG